MNTHSLLTETNAEQAIMETNALAESGFTEQEIASLLQLRQWYQTGGSDRMDMVRHLEFLKFLMMHGKFQS